MASGGCSPRRAAVPSCPCRWHCPASPRAPGRLRLFLPSGVRALGHQGIELRFWLQSSGCWSGSPSPSSSGQAS
eukprot:15825782-Heterocapsa_arctica.AAC.1